MGALLCPTDNPEFDGQEFKLAEAEQKHFDEHRELLYEPPNCGLCGHPWDAHIDGPDDPVVEAQVRPILEAIFLRQN